MASKTRSVCPIYAMLLFSIIPILTVYAVHILEYENYDGYDKTVTKIRNSDVRV